MNPFGRKYGVPTRLSPGRVIAALCVAVAADGLQVMLVPVWWTFAQTFIDVVAMILTVAIIGFHPLLLPTFVIEFIPVVDALPTWTGCVAAVIMLRQRAARHEINVTPVPPESASPPPPPPLPPVPPLPPA